MTFFKFDFFKNLKYEYVLNSSNMQLSKTRNNFLVIPYISYAV
jgi:hypothetical protein